MTEKRFTQKDEDDWEILDRGKHFAYAHSGYQAEKIIQELNELVETNRELYEDNKQLKKEKEQLKLQYSEIEITLMNNQLAYNDLEKENEQLKMENNELKLLVQNWEALDEEKDEQLDKQNQALKKLKKENKQLVKEKERYKRLSEIRNETINNRILTIKEFIKNCSDNKVRRVLKELFYSEVKEFDLSAQNRELLHENEELKSEKKDMQILINTISDQRNEFHRVARENANRVGKLEKENENLKQAYNDAKKDVEKKEQILQDIMEDNLLIQDMKKELEE